MRTAATRRKAQSGAALLTLAAALVLGVAMLLIVRMKDTSAVSIVERRNHNAAVLEQARKALIGHVALTAVKAGEDNPGRLPCPEQPSSIGTASEGTEAATCATPAIGRLPWRTLGLDKLVDSRSEPLWYVVSPGWAYTGSSLVINSNTVGQLTVDGQANAAVALIIAPDVAMTVQPSAGCTALPQPRSAPSATINAAHYIECYNTASSTFATTGPAASFNDQVIRITVADVMPAIEAAIAKRVEREIVPALRTVYQPANWGFAGANPVFPFAAPFANPATSSMQGAAATTQGLPPLSHAETSPLSGTACTPGPSDPRCNPTFTAWTGSASMSGPSTYSETCTVTASAIDCTYYYRCILIFCPVGNAAFTLTATAANVGMAMRQLNSSVTMTNVQSAGRTVTANLNSDGSAAVTLTGTTDLPGGTGAFLPTLLGNTLCGLSALLSLTVGCKQNALSVPIFLFADHSLLDSTSTGVGATGWYLRNRWHELTYYTVASGYTPAGVAGTPSCTTGTNCLSATNVAPAGAQRAMLILAGRSIDGSARPSGALGNYLEFGNATSAFERQPVSTASTPTLKNPFNDRIVVVDQN